MENHGKRDDLGLFEGQGVQATTKAGQFADGTGVALTSDGGPFYGMNDGGTLRGVVYANPRGSFVVKDSGQRQEYASGMRRDTTEGKPLYILLPRAFLKRFAMHLTKGAEKYGRDNWTLANSQEELDRFKDSAFRHFIQWLDGETDEDHMAAVAFNLAAAEHVKEKLKEGK